MSQTEKFLKDAFAGEAQANRKYADFARKADKEGYIQAARLFTAAAAAESVHATNHLKAQNAIKSTKDNLREAIAGEDHEFMSMYPEMIDSAKAEKNKEAEMSFHYANEVEKIHSKLFQKLLSGLSPSQEQFPYYVCPCCGNTVEKEPPAKCPICGADGKLFKRID